MKKMIIFGVIALAFVVVIMLTLGLLTPWFLWLDGYNAEDIPVNPLLIIDPSCLDHTDDVITVSCGEVNLFTMSAHLNVPISVGEKVWLLNDNIIVNDGAILDITDIDTNWLKINGTYKIEVAGRLVIDETKITSWSTLTNAVIPTHVNGTTPRPWIEVIGVNANATITDSEIAYLGYQAPHVFGLTFYASNIDIIGNEIHHLNYGFYSHTTDSHDILIENNSFHSNRVYGIDPHSGTHDLTARNNEVFNNGRHGIICSGQCVNILIEDNHSYSNGVSGQGDGIMLHDEVTLSTVQNNNVHDNVDDQISLYLNSNNNTIINNTLEGGRNGIRLNDGSGFNTVSNNNIDGPSLFGIYINTGAHDNTGSGNIITNFGDDAIFISGTAGCCNTIS